MTTFKFIREGWTDSDVGDADERATFTRLRIMAGNAIVTRAFSKRGGGETEALNVPLFPLADFIAKQWWPLLYEPVRSQPQEAFAARHRLDLPMHGYAFPALGLCSAGDDALVVDWAVIDSEYSPLKFLTNPFREPLQISRDDVEPELMDLIESALTRLQAGTRAHAALADNWKRVRETLESPDQINYCMAAGRLGIDPYDPDSVDVSQFVGDLPEDLFNDISEASDLSRIADTTKWAQEARDTLNGCPTIDVQAFGQPPRDDLHGLPGDLGFRAARMLRHRLGLSDNDPKRATAAILGDADSLAGVLTKRGPDRMTGLTHRTNGVAHIGTIAASARQRHFRACSAAYIAWCSDPGDLRAGTVALTRRQQASRAFAAEMVAPVSYLIERGGNSGFTEDDIEQEAGTLIAPHDTVMWQALRGGVPLLDVEPRSPRRNSFFDTVSKDEG
ncbi:hypothetical protein [Lichenibacterium dinghuense]|uniref:hypothetical protein n=1 Tax=Lichenibacterium dinghuense TaxID=2895977 RepID=UPI001F3E9BE4|nr:hypothetical protein [Lichenibacterium sp. 6Y81]